MNHSRGNKHMRRNKLVVRSLFMAVAAAIVVAGLFVGSAGARKVLNPGNVTFSVTSGQLKVGSNEFESGSPEEPITFAGTVAANGAVNVPQANIIFPPIDPIAGPLGNINVTIVPKGPATGNINPMTGIGTLSVSIKVNLSGGGLSGDCRIDPINLVLSTQTAGGVAYNASAGTLTLADQTFSVPGAQGCSYILGNANGLVNDNAGIPSPSGNNFAILGASASPIIQKGVQANLTATPDSGLDPLNTTLSAAASIAPATPLSYRFDFTNDGTFDTAASPSASVAHSYPTPGTYTARVRVTDADGDFDDATKTITVQARVPDLEITKSHTDTFVEGVDSEFKIGVKGVGTGPGNGPVTVTDTLDPGFTFVSADGGPDWDCSASAGQNVSCTHAGGYTESEVLPDITVTVTPNVGTGNQTIENTATVANASDGVAGNNSSTDSVTIISAGIDLRMDKQTEGPAFLRGRRGTWILEVKNIGNQPTTNDIVVTDALPANTTLVSAAGAGFDCEASTSTNVSCELRAPAGLQPDETTQVRVRVDVGAGAPDPLVNTASVATGGDTVSGNDSDTENTVVRDTGVDLVVDKTHSGTFEREQTATYSIVAKNQGTLGTAGPITVTDTLPVGLEFVSATGGGWVCNGSAANPIVTCTRGASLQADSQAPAITLRVKIKEDAPDSVTNEVSVTNEPLSNPNHVDLDPLNNTDSDPTDVRTLGNDLQIDKTHVGTAFTAGKPHVFNISVKNIGGDRTLQPITVTDNVPANFVVSSVAGTGWSCNTGQNITCTRATELLPGATAPDIVISGVPNRFAPPSVSNTASVATHNDTNSTNDSDTDVATVNFPPANTKPITSVVGSVTYPSTVSGNATMTINVNRTLLGSYTGSVKVVDPGANHNITATLNVFNQVARYGLNGANGNANLSNGQKIYWTVDDLSAINLGKDDVFVYAPSGYHATTRTSTAGDISVLPAP